MQIRIYAAALFALFLSSSTASADIVRSGVQMLANTLASKGGAKGLVAGTGIAAKLRSDETGEPYFDSFIKDGSKYITKDVAVGVAGRVLTSAGIGGPAGVLAKMATGKLVGDAFEKTLRDMASNSNEGTIGGLQAKLSSTSNITGTLNGIQQYDLMNSQFNSGDQPVKSGKHFDNSNPNLLSKKSHRSDDPDRQLLGEAPNAGQQLLNGLIQDTIINGIQNLPGNNNNPYAGRHNNGVKVRRDNSKNNGLQPRNEGCGPGVDYATDTPKSCF